MANVKISDLPAASTPLTGTELVPIVQSGVTSQTTVDNLLNPLAETNGSSLVTYLPSGTGAVATTVQAKLRETVSVKDFGAVGNGSVDDTDAIQKAINYASNSNVMTIYFPAGTYNYSRLYCVYDAVNNPNYNVNRNAQIRLIGDGVKPETGQIAGTILASTVTTGNAFIVSNAADDTSPYKSKEFECENITFTANTSGYVVFAAGVILCRFYNCKIFQSNISGSGLYISTAFFGTLEKMQINNYGIGSPTGAAIKFETTVLAGLFTLRDININGFAYGFHRGSGSWENISIYDSELMGTIYAIYIESGWTHLLNIQGCYFEGACTNFIKVVPTNGLDNLTINASWFYSNSLTGTAINLTTPHAVSINGCYSLNQYTTFLNIDNSVLGYSGGAFVVSAHTFNYSANPTSIVTYFTGVLPFLSGIEYPSSNTYCLLNSANSKSITFVNNFAGSNYFNAGHIFETVTWNIGAVAGGSIDLTNAGNPPSFAVAYNVTSPTTFNLPPINYGLPHGYAMTITSDVNSTQTFPVKWNSVDGSVTVANIAPGGQRRFVFFTDGSKTGNINSGSNTLTVDSGVGITNGMSICVAGAGVSGNNLITTVSSGGGTTTLTLAASASTTVPVGTAVIFGSSVGWI